MLLHYSPNSPYVRKVVIASRELGLEDKITKQDTGVNPTVPTEFRLINPSGKIPTLISDSGKAYFGSQVILQYLDHVAGGNKIIPTELEARADVLTLESIADGILDAALLARYETAMRPQGLQWDAWISGQMDKITKGLKALSGRLPGTTKSTTVGALLPDPTVSGPLSLGGIAAACALWYLDFRYADTVKWRETEEGKPLTEWYAAVQKRSSWL